VTVNLTGIGNGGMGDIQVTATTNNTSQIPAPTVNYTSPDSTGSVQFTPASGLNNCSSPGGITVTVTSPCGTKSQSMGVTVGQPAAPTLNDFSDQTTCWTAIPGLIVIMSNITAGKCNRTGFLQITASTSNTGVISGVTVNWTNPNTTGSLTFGQGFAKVGTAKITVTLTDNNTGRCGTTTTIQKTFNVTVNNC
jgi:hypothetical protein